LRTRQSVRPRLDQPGSAGLHSPALQQSRERDQFVAAIAITGDTTDLFSLRPGRWTSPWATSSEETGEVEFDSAIQRGQTCNQGGRPNFGGGFDVFGAVRRDPGSRC
jgi:hypothetical protein